MPSVTTRIKQIKQPRGGFLPLNNFTVNDMTTFNKLKPHENISASKVGLVVDYLTRFKLTNDLEHAFDISIAGAKLWDKIEKGANAKMGIPIEQDTLAYLSYLLSGIKDIDDDSIAYASRLVEFDSVVRVGPVVYLKSHTAENIDKLPDPDNDTCFNIREMIKRSLNFWNEYGPITHSGFTMEGGYTKQIHSGDGDYLTQHTLWDLKTSKRVPTKNPTLQILIYYLMGLHSVHPYFKDINTIGLYNPRLAKIYTLDVHKIDPNIIKTVERKVIGYK